MSYITLSSVKSSALPDCCQAMDWIEHNYTKGLPHEHTPIVENYPKISRRTEKEKQKESEIKRTIDSFIHRQFTKDWR